MNKYPEIGKTYLHYKGGKYKVLTLATHSENGEVLVVYQSIHFGSIYARPLSMWFEEVFTEKKIKTPRFQEEVDN